MCGQKTIVPSTGDSVTVKILSVNPRFAKAHMMCVKDVVLSEPFRGQIRKEDVRSVEKDRVEMYKSFRYNVKNIFYFIMTSYLWPLFFVF